MGPDDYFPWLGEAKQADQTGDDLDQLIAFAQAMGGEIVEHEQNEHPA